MRFLKSFLVFFAALFLLVSNAHAQELVAPEILPVDRTNPASFLGQAHDYSVVYRGNGEAVVSLRVAFTANENKDTVELRLPLNVKVSDALAFQVIKEPPCIRYSQSSNLVPNLAPSCLEHGEADYFQPYYGTNLYQKAEVLLEGDTLKVKLPKAVTKDKSGSFFVYFRAMGMARKNLVGAYDFEFESLKVNESIQRLNLGISVDADQYLKGAKGEVDYRFDSSALSAAPQAAEARKSTQIDQFYNTIGYGTINKNASSLAPLESYKIAGTYSDSRLKLYAKETVIALSIFLIVIFVAFVLAKLFSRSLNQFESGKNLAICFGVSILSVILMSIYSVGIMALLQILTQFYYQGAQFLYMAVLFISFVIYSVLVVLPAVVIGVKKGLGWGVLTLTLTLTWTITLVMIAAFVIFASNGRDPITPLMYNSSLEAKPGVQRLTE